MYLNDNQPQSPVGTGPANAAWQQQTARHGYADAYKRYKQAWDDLNYAAMGNAALDMRDILRELTIAQGNLFV